MITETQLRKIVHNVQCDFMGQAFQFRVQPKGEGWTLQCRIMRPDTESGTWAEGGGGKYYVSPHSTEDEIVKKCFAACMAYAEHEVREGFRWKERRVFGPHIDLDALWRAAEHVSYRDTREEPAGAAEGTPDPSRARYVQPLPPDLVR
jgi:hypothetical protein